MGDSNLHHSYPPGFIIVYIFQIATTVTKYDGTALSQTVPVSTFIERRANTNFDVLVIQVGPDQNAYYKVRFKSLIIG